MSATQTRKATRRKKPLTDKQRIAIARRRERYDVQQELELIAGFLRDYIPEGRRCDVLHAIRCVVMLGPLFAIACGKAAVLRGQFGPLQADAWGFVDYHNAEFREHMPARIVENWNRACYPELLAKTEQAS